MGMRLAVFPLLLLAGCSGMNQAGPWPSLATRPGEQAPLVPRTPLGPFAGCGQDMIAAPAPVAAPLPPLPADIPARLAAVDAALAQLELQMPAQRRAALAAIAAAGGDDGGIEVARSRYESLFLGLGIQDRALDAIGDDATGTTGSDAVAAQVAALRARLAALDAARTL
ncbi:MAG: hypothetical protein CFE37_03240 [Alphaproteobacteria bacterium PA4]|nr:MAG: hypothetical protein CFE37_03240 [Alphaproteobacteria bacterium PA4]